jgi:hypothetical protein
VLVLAVQETLQDVVTHFVLLARQRTLGANLTLTREKEKTGKAISKK